VHKFTELARYAPDDVSTETRKMARFLKGLRPELKTILASQDFLNFSHLSNKAIQVERAKEEIPGSPSSAARPSPESSILWASTQGTKLQ
jgi:hypothetical protein